MFEDIKFRIKLFSLQALHLLLIMILGATGLIGMARIKSELRIVYEDHAPALIHLSGVLDDVHEIRSLIGKAASNAPSSTLPTLTTEITRLEKNRSKLWNGYIGTNLEPEEEIIAQRCETSWDTYLKTVTATLTALRQGQATPALERQLRDADETLDHVRTALRDLIEVQKQDIGHSYLNANKLFVKIGIFNLILVCFGLGLAGVLFFWDYVRLRRSTPQ